MGPAEGVLPDGLGGGPPVGFHSGRGNRTGRPDPLPAVATYLETTEWHVIF